MIPVLQHHEELQITKNLTTVGNTLEEGLGYLFNDNIGYMYSQHDISWDPAMHTSVIVARLYFLLYETRLVCMEVRFNLGYIKDSSLEISTYINQQLTEYLFDAIRKSDDSRNFKTRRSRKS